MANIVILASGNLRDGFGVKPESFMAFDHKVCGKHGPPDGQHDLQDAFECLTKKDKSLIVLYTQLCSLDDPSLEQIEAMQDILAEALDNMYLLEFIQAVEEGVEFSTELDQTSDDRACSIDDIRSTRAHYQVIIEDLQRHQAFYAAYLDRLDYVLTNFWYISEYINLAPVEKKRIHGNYKRDRKQIVNMLNRISEHLRYASLNPWDCKFIDEYYYPKEELKLKSSNLAEHHDSNSKSVKASEVPEHAGNSIENVGPVIEADNSEARKGGFESQRVSLDRYFLEVVFNYRSEEGKRLNAICKKIISNYSIDSVVEAGDVLSETYSRCLAKISRGFVILNHYSYVKRAAISYIRERGRGNIINSKKDLRDLSVFPIEVSRVSGIVGFGKTSLALAFSRRFGSQQLWVPLRDVLLFFPGHGSSQIDQLNQLDLIRQAIRSALISAVKELSLGPTLRERLGKLELEADLLDNVGGDYRGVVNDPLDDVEGYAGDEQLSHQNPTLSPWTETALVGPDALLGNALAGLTIFDQFVPLAQLSVVELPEFAGLRTDALVGLGAESIVDLSRTWLNSVADVAAMFQSGTPQESVVFRVRNGALNLPDGSVFSNVMHGDWSDGTFAQFPLHTLGFCNLWEVKGLVDYAKTPFARYTGEQALAAFQGLGASTPFIPLDTTGQGSADLHWNDAFSQGEVMTIDPLTPQNPLFPISAVILAALTDLGYAVNLDWVAPGVSLLGSISEPSEFFFSEDDKQKLAELVAAAAAQVDATISLPIVIPPVDVSTISPTIVAHAERFDVNGEYFAGSLVPDDYFRFTVSRPGYVTLSLEDLLADADLYLYDSRNRLIAKSARGGITDEKIIANLAAGTYLARVHSASGVTTDYNLKVRYDGIPTRTQIGGATNPTIGKRQPTFSDPRLENIFVTARDKFAAEQWAAAQPKINALEEQKRQKQREIDALLAQAVAELKTNIHRQLNEELSNIQDQLPISKVDENGRSNHSGDGAGENQKIEEEKKIEAEKLLQSHIKRFINSYGDPGPILSYWGCDDFVAYQFSSACLLMKPDGSSFFFRVIDKTEAEVHPPPTNFMGRQEVATKTLDNILEFPKVNSDGIVYPSGFNTIDTKLDEITEFGLDKSRDKIERWDDCSNHIGSGQPDLVNHETLSRYYDLSRKDDPSIEEIDEMLEILGRAEDDEILMKMISKIEEAILLDD